MNFKRIDIFIPGLLLAATGVGAGDLITGTLAGYHVGPVCIFAVVLGVLLKYTLNESLARYQIATKNTLMEGWIKEFGRFFHGVFILYLIIWSYSVGGALITACGVAMDAILPLGNFKLSKTIWGVFHSILGVFLVLKLNFKNFSKIISVFIIFMFVGVVITAILLFPSASEWTQATKEVSFTDKNINWIIGVLGGVGGTLTILSYGYWIQEKNRDNDKGLALCKIDLKVSYILTGIFSVSMIILGNQLNISGSKEDQFSLELANRITALLGPIGGWIFKIGFWASVFSSLIGVLQSVPYIFANYVFSIKNKTVKHVTRSNYYIYYVLFIALVPISTLYFKVERIQLFYAILGAFFMPFLAISLLIFNNKKVAKKYKNTVLKNSLLLLTILLFLGIAVQKLITIF